MLSHIKSNSSVGLENNSLGIITKVAPTQRVLYISFTETSKSKGAWLPMISFSFILKVSVNISIKSITDLWHIVTPLGVPVEPDVKLIYKGSISKILVLALFINSSSISSFISSYFITLLFLKVSKTSL